MFDLENLIWPINNQEEFAFPPHEEFAIPCPFSNPEEIALNWPAQTQEELDNYRPTPEMSSLIDDLNQAHELTCVARGKSTWTSPTRPRLSVYHHTNQKDKDKTRAQAKARAKAQVMAEIKSQVWTKSWAQEQAINAIWPLRSHTSGVALPVLKTLCPKQINNWHLPYQLRLALSSVLGLNAKLEDSAKLCTLTPQELRQKMNLVYREIHRLFLVPTMANSDLEHLCQNQIELRLQEFTPRQLQAWQSKFSPLVLARFELYPAALLLVLAYHQLQSKKEKRAKACSHQSQDSSVAGVSAPWHLHNAKISNMIAEAERSQLHPLHSSHALRVQLKAFSQAFIRIEQTLKQLEQGKDGLKLRPIVNQLEHIPPVEHISRLVHQIPEALLTDLITLTQHTERLLFELTISPAQIFLEPYSFALDLDRSLALHQQWHLLQCYDYCLYVYTALNLNGPLGQILPNLTPKLTLLRSLYWGHYAYRPITNPTVCKNQLLNMVPGYFLDFLALPSYILSLEQAETFMRLEYQAKRKE